MKGFISTLLLIILLQSIGVSQNTLSKDDCLKMDDSPKVFIPGFKDCIYDGKNISFRINPEILKNGFELKVTDTTIRVISFQLTFEYGEDLIDISSTGSKILPRNDSTVSLRKIAESELIFIDNIKVIKDSRNYKIPSLVLYCIKD